MGAVSFLGAFALTIAAQTSPADWRPLIAEASARCGVPEPWIERVMRAESGGRTRLGGRPIRSSKGAMGLMQLMPATWLEMRGRLGLGTDPDDPRDNIVAGSCYLRLMYDRFGYPGLFGAYNAGPGRYDAYVSSGRPLPGETVGYLASVTGGRPATAPIAVPTRPTVAADHLFAVRRSQVETVQGKRSDTMASTLFVALSDGE